MHRIEIFQKLSVSVKYLGLFIRSLLFSSIKCYTYDQLYEDLCIEFQFFENYNMSRTRAIISRGLYSFYPISKDHFFVFKEAFSENSVLMYGLYSRAASNQEQLMMNGNNPELLETSFHDFTRLAYNVLKVIFLKRKV